MYKCITTFLVFKLKGKPKIVFKISQIAKRFLPGVIPSSAAMSPEAVDPSFGASRGSLFFITGIGVVVVTVVTVVVGGVGDGVL